MTRPGRLRLSRRKGFDLQAISHALNGLPAVKVDRSTHFGNPFVVGIDGTTERCVELYRMMLAGYLCLTCEPSVEDQQKHINLIATARDILRGRNLACWCAPDKPCHADVLLEIANAVRTAVNHGEESGDG